MVRRRSATRRSATRRSATRRSATRRSATRRSATRRSATRRSATRRSATRRSATRRSATGQKHKKTYKQHGGALTQNQKNLKNYYLEIFRFPFNDTLINVKEEEEMLNARLDEIGAYEIGAEKMNTPIARSNNRRPNLGSSDSLRGNRNY
jgi:hypothetical protein